MYQKLLYQKLFVFHAKEDPNERQQDFFFRTTKNLSKKKSSDLCSWKDDTKPETESATFFRSIKLCADDKFSSTAEDANWRVQNQKTTFDRLEHSAISDRLHF